MAIGLARRRRRPAADVGTERQRLGWTALLPGFIVAGIGVGLLNPVIADVAVSVVSKDRSGMAAGINDTFRQVAIAVGVAAWGAIFLARGADKIAALDGGHAGGHRRSSPRS